MAPSASRPDATVRRARVAACSLASAALALLAPLGSAAEERRCRELGASCYCSEPLDNTDTYSVSVHDPSDSTTKQCGIYDAATPGQGTADFPVRFPPGATARHVLSVADDTGVGKLLVWPSPPSIEMTNRTFCVRSYRNYGQSHALPGNVKIARIGDAKGVSWQSSWSAAGGAAAEPSVSWVSTWGAGGAADCHLGTTGTAAQRIHFPDCQSHWCRFEICSDHDGATGALRVRAQWTQVAGPKHMESALGAPGQYGSDCSPEPTVTATIHGNVAPAEFATVCCPENPGGSIYLSHVMVSLGPYDPTFWIGPAVEVEGGGATPAP